MAHPKRKISKSRRDKRRTHYKGSVPSLTRCSNCAEIKLSHRACPNCGQYAGRSMFVPES